MKWFAIAIALGASWAGARRASAVPPAARPAAAVVGDTDGAASLHEARAAALRLFERFDRDGDGVVTRAEAAAPRPPASRERFEARFDARDTDRDGAWSPWESRLPRRQFSHVDRDGDGRLSRDEVWRDIQRARRRGGNLDRLRDLLWRHDLDRDGRVTRSEVSRAAELRFRRRDRDGDGRLTPGDAAPRR